MVTNAQDILSRVIPSVVKDSSVPVGISEASQTSFVTRSEIQIYDLLQLEPLSVDELAIKLNLDIVTMGNTLTMMSLSNKITEVNGKFVISQ